MIFEHHNNTESTENEALYADNVSFWFINTVLAAVVFKFRCSLNISTDLNENLLEIIIFFLEEWIGLAKRPILKPIDLEYCIQLQVPSSWRVGAYKLKSFSFKIVA